MFGTEQTRATSWENATRDFILLVILLYFFETQSHISQAGPPLAIYLKMTLNCLKPGALCVLVKNSTK